MNNESLGLTKAIEEFSKIYYHTPVIDDKPAWQNTYWMGIPSLKCPLDLWIYQEIIFEQKPDFIIECGVAFGGTTAFFADMCKLLSKGKVIGIDIKILNETRANLMDYERIQLIEGSSVSSETVQQIKEIVGDRNTIVILDSDHRKEHVVQELNLYSKLIASGGYIIVEDTNINGHPVYPDYGEGPMEAVHEFLEINPDFYIDKNCHKFLNTFNPNGYLKRL